ncbi:MAG: V-type ATPase subunit, partial [Actinomycetia bacterium]|nr:V-type ATPase subunit [Actinomycetes bacterium]
IPEGKFDSFLSSEFDVIINSLPDIFKEHTGKDHTIHGIDLGYSESMKELKDVFSMAPDESLLKTIFIKYDFFNLKTVILSKIKNVEYKDMMIPYSLYDPALFNEMAENMNFYHLDPILLPAVENAYREYYLADKDTQVFELVFDKTAELELLSYIKTFSAGIYNYMMLELVRKEFTSFVRAFIRKLKWTVVKNIVLESRDEKIYQRLYNTGVDSWGSHIGQLGNSLTTGFFKKYLEGKDLESVLKSIEMRKKDMLYRFTFKPAGYEVLFSYAERKQREIYNIRLLLIGKLNNLDTAEIKKRFM